ncbi:uncharacterized protein TRIVIDRAFT_60222 [Trichoderma virens Gv29-8]|uniref:Transcription factor domain-containing protein n=1 Tax=Hypocrea virens (strain Gv29-8 / FGSC 10586) TaxID=413071 RepID=G9MSA1_HYPVG|nr:uncharacterized protein TRIVIDRAFT_60222 [Trichoderma virens Gv29-8]EHK22960.1 hypothetical protein TRIVIDRAFT_60222 [Trichoderma virens Gv29-8]UKZ48014.1 hypothetical protein TrVGV298_002250 [Trichoderma virens]
MQVASLQTSQNACTFCRKRKRAASTEETQNQAASAYIFTSSDSPRFPEAYFLDHRVFQQNGQSAPGVRLLASPQIATFVGDLQTIVAEYIQRIHWWIPILSRNQLLLSLETPTAETETDLLLLVLAMKVILWNPSTQHSTNPRTEGYLLARRAIDEAVLAGAMSCRLLQAQILLAIFELGHAIYPAAYLSVDRLGIEERRRAWWMVLILDRFTQLGNPQRPLSTADPQRDSLLPSDEENFDQGVKFQVSNMIRVMIRILTLDKTLNALLNLSYAEGEIRRTAVCAQTSICYSGLIALHDPQSSRIDQQHMQFAIDMLMPVVESMAWDSKIFLSGFRVSVADASPLLLLWAYQASTIYNRLLSQYQKESLFLLYQMKLKLRVMSQRWLAGAITRKPCF